MSVQTSTLFLINFVINAYIPKSIPKEIEELIVLFTNSQDFMQIATYANNSTRFERSIAGWQMQINISFTESRINKFVNAQMSKNNVPVYIPYVVERKWSIKKLKQVILKMNGIGGDSHEEYTLWMWRRRFYEPPRYTWMFAPDVDDNMKMKKLYNNGFKAYIPVSGNNGNKKWKTVGRKLNAGEECILSKDEPQRREEDNLYGWQSSNENYIFIYGWRYVGYTKAQLFKLWGGKDLTRDDHDLGGIWNPQY